MYVIETTEEFDNWLGGIRDGKTQKVIVKRIRTMSLGTLGKVRSLDDGLFEAKIDYGPGFRLYFINRGQRIIVLLCGGDKSTQQADIKTARKLAKELS
jgi:putative addiction module killer protein